MSDHYNWWLGPHLRPALAPPHPRFRRGSQGRGAKSEHQPPFKFGPPTSLPSASLGWTRRASGSWSAQRPVRSTPRLRGRPARASLRSSTGVRKTAAQARRMEEALPMQHGVAHRSTGQHGWSTFSAWGQQLHLQGSTDAQDPPSLTPVSAHPPPPAFCERGGQTGAAAFGFSKPQPPSPAWNTPDGPIGSDDRSPSPARDPSSRDAAGSRGRVKWIRAWLAITGNVHGVRACAQSARPCMMRGSDGMSVA